MKLIPLLLIAVLLSAGCSQSETQVLLLRADSLMATRPDSALTLLESASLTEFIVAADKAQYALLLTQARDKNDVEFTNDSLITIAVDYYSAARDYALLAKAHYYRGRVYQRLFRVTKTMREFVRATIYSEEVQDKELLSLVYADFAYFLSELELSPQADSLFAKAEELNVQQKDSARWALALANRGTNYIVLGAIFYPVAEQYLQRALVVAEKMGNRRAEWAAVSALSTLNSNLQNDTLAATYARRQIALSDTSQSIMGYFSLGNAYLKMNQYDSATIYLTKCLSDDNYRNYRIKENACMLLVDIARTKGDLKNEIKFSKFVVRYRDNLKKAAETIDVSDLDNMHSQRTEQTYQTFFDRNFSYFFYFALLFLSVMIFLIYKDHKYYRRMVRARKERERLQESLRQK